MERDNRRGNLELILRLKENNPSDPGAAIGFEHRHTFDNVRVDDKGLMNINYIYKGMFDQFVQAGERKLQESQDQ